MYHGIGDPDHIESVPPFAVDSGRTGLPISRAVIGQTVGSYQVVGKIAEGGMGVVYRAHHPMLGKVAAIKVLLPEFSANQDIVNRFFNEARAATAIRHPGIVEIYDFGYLPNGMGYIVMEFLDGEPLARRMAQQGRLDERTALSIIRGSASALAAAHAKGIVHRDLKPDNIFLVPDPDMPTGERPKLLDFGIAKLADNQRPGEHSARTRTGAVMGTPTYMSPEQCRGAGHVDHRSDIYSLGCILYEMLTGRPPFVAEGVGEIIGAHLFFPPTPPTQLVPTISAQAEALTMQLLAKKPEERVQSAAELARMLGFGSAPAMVPTVAGTYPGQPVATLTPTTLSGSAGAQQTVPPAAKKSKAGLFAALGGVAVAGGVAIALTMGGGNAGTETEAAPKTTAPAPAPVPAPDPVPDPVPVPVPAPDPAPVPVAVDAGVAEVATPVPPPEKKKEKKKREKKKSGTGTSTGTTKSDVPIETDI
jgi:eukaryotic-like serine/threonine-protein kinase